MSKRFSIAYIGLFFMVLCPFCRLLGMNVSVVRFNYMRDAAAAKRIGLEGIAGGISEAYRFLTPKESKVARIGNQTVGFIDYDLHSEDGFDQAYAYIAFLGVAENMRGKGIGKILINRVIADIRKHGFRYIKLDVLRDNISAMQRFESMGFVAQKAVKPDETVFMVYDILNNKALLI